jgi:putative membrane protein
MADRASKPRHFWEEVVALRGTVTARVLPGVIAFGAIAELIYFAFRLWPGIAIEVGPHELAGALLGILMVARTTNGYDRWWEARKAWGGIVNQSRNLALVALAYGPADPDWRGRVVRWTVAFAHAARARLQGGDAAPQLAALLGGEAAAVEGAAHPPGMVALRIAALLAEARQRLGLDGFAFLQADRERAQLIDHLGACERILATPLPRIYSVAERRFVFIFLATVPFALLHKVEADWLVPFFTMLLAYLVLSLDQIGIELQNPFSPRNLSHLPLDEICKTIERNLLDLLDAKQPPV